MRRLVWLVLFAATGALAQFANPPQLSYATSAGAGRGLAVDRAGNAYVPGAAAGCNIAKVNPSGTAVSCQNSPFTDPVGLIGLDSSGSIYAVYISPSELPLTEVVKLSPDATKILYRTWINGVWARALAVDPAGRLDLTGSATLGFNPYACVSIPRIPPGCVTGGFAARLNASGQIECQTYLGDGAYGSSIAPDSQETPGLRDLAL